MKKVAFRFYENKARAVSDPPKEKVKQNERYQVAENEQRGSGSSVFEPLVKVGLFNFQLPLNRGGSSCFFFPMGIGIHLTQSTTKVTPFKQLNQVT